MTIPALEGGPPRLLHAVAGVALLVGAVGSLAMMLYVGRRNESAFLMVLFAGWVGSPFLALALADRRSDRWTTRARRALHSLMLLVALGSLVVYGLVAFGPPRPRPAAAFLLVPAASWLLLPVVVLISVLGSRRAARQTLP
jgi:hypothetical protein